MKKQTRKLQLNRATIQALTDQGLNAVNGGKAQGNYVTALSYCECSISGGGGRQTCSCALNCAEL